MRERQEELQAKRIEIAVVTFEAGFLARAYVEETGLTWPVLVGESRELYRAYGMLAAGFWDIWGPATWIAYFREIVHGRRLKKSSGDIHQRGGDVLIDPQGIVRFHHVGSGPANRPPVDSLLRYVEEGATPAPMPLVERGKGETGRRV